MMIKNKVVVRKHTGDTPLPSPPPAQQQEAGGASQHYRQQARLIRPGPDRLHRQQAPGLAGRVNELKATEVKSGRSLRGRQPCTLVRAGQGLEEKANGKERKVGQVHNDQFSKVFFPL